MCQVSKILYKVNLDCICFFVKKVEIKLHYRKIIQSCLRVKEAT